MGLTMVQLGLGPADADFIHILILHARLRPPRSRLGGTWRLRAWRVAHAPLPRAIVSVGAHSAHSARSGMRRLR